MARKSKKKKGSRKTRRTKSAANMLLDLMVKRCGHKTVWNPDTRAEYLRCARATKASIKSPALKRRLKNVKP